MNVKNTVFDAKRLIGRRFSDHALHEDMTDSLIEVVFDERDSRLIWVEFTNETKQFTPEISSTVQMKLCQTAGVFMKKEVNNGFVTDPYFSTSPSFKRQG